MRDIKNKIQYYQWYDLKDKKSELTGWGVRDKGGRGRKSPAKGMARTNVQRQEYIHSTFQELRWGHTLWCKRQALRHSIKWLRYNLFQIKIAFYYGSWTFGIRSEFSILWKLNIAIVLVVTSCLTYLIDLQVPWNSCLQIHLYFFWGLYKSGI